MKKYKQISSILLGITIFYQVFLTSYWQTEHTASVWKYIGYLLYIILLFAMIAIIYRFPFYRNQLLIFLSFFVIMLYYIIIGNLNVGSSFLIGIYMFVLGYTDILKTYFFSLLSAVSVVVLLSLSGLFPIWRNGESLVLGFRNSNSLGFYLVIIFLIYAVLSWNSTRLIVYVFGTVLSVFLVVIINDFTGFSMVIGMVFLRICKPVLSKMLANKFFTVIICLIPIFMTCLTFWIGLNYNNYYWLSKVNDVFTSRPAIWNYYLTNYRFSLFGTTLGDVTIFRGAFDGSYLYYPMVNGLVISIIILLAITRTLHILVIQNNIALISLLLVLLMAAFSENSPTIFYQSPLIPLAIMIGTIGTANPLNYSNFLMRK